MSAMTKLDRYRKGDDPSRNGGTKTHQPSTTIVAAGTHQEIPDNANDDPTEINAAEQHSQCQRQLTVSQKNSTPRGASRLAIVLSPDVGLTLALQSSFPPAFKCGGNP
jgi:hypothetical protein